jgi:hypothetical protein
MGILAPTLTVFDWVALGVLASVLLLIALGAYRLRQEIQETARIEATTREESAAEQVRERG